MVTSIKLNIDFQSFQLSSRVSYAAGFEDERIWNNHAISRDAPNVDTRVIKKLIAMYRFLPFLR